MISGGNTYRIRSVGEGWDQGSGQSVVVKHTSSPAKTSKAVGALIDYIACAHRSVSRPAMHLDLYDEFGAIVPFGQRRAQLRNWHILSDADNRKPGREGSSPDDMRRYQAHHLIWSIDAGQAGLSDEDAEARMQAITRDFIFQNFAMEGRPVLWTIHRDKPGRPHVHMVISGFDEDGRALALDRSRRKLDDFCADIARLGRVYDVPLVFSRREDRPGLRSRIYQGVDTLRSNRKRVSYERSTDLRERAPIWWRAHSQHLLETLSDIESGREVKPRPYRRRGDSLDLLGELFDGIYADPRAAAERFARMVFGKGDGKERALAIWYFLHRPEYFGHPASRKFPDFDLRRKIAESLGRINHFPRLAPANNGDAWRDLLAFRRKRRQGRDIDGIRRSLEDLATIADDNGVNPLTVSSIRLVAREAAETAATFDNAKPRGSRRTWPSLLSTNGLSLFKRDK